MTRSLIFVSYFACFILSYSLYQKSIQPRKVSRWNLRMSSKIDDEYDVVIIGSGIGGLSAAAVLSSIYKLRIGVFESHYHAGGCTHSFEFKRDIKYKFDSGPTILLGCSRKPYNPLQQVFNAIGAENEIKWLQYQSWGMVDETGTWNFELGENIFENGPLLRYGGSDAVKEFQALRQACEPLIVGSTNIPTMNLRGDKYKVLPLLSHIDALKKVIPYADVLNGSFKSFMDQYVENDWLTAWLNALAFSLSGLPADRTGAAAMAYTLYDLHRQGACLDYPQGGIGRISEVLVNIIQSTGSHVHLSCPVEQIIVSNNGQKVDGIRLKNHNGKYIKAKKGVICNTDIWSLSSLLSKQHTKLNPQQIDFFYKNTTNKEYTKSFLHLHLAINSEGLDISKMQPHYTVMDQGLQNIDPCNDRNMVAVSNPSVLDTSLCDVPNRLLLHAYGAGNENYDDWLRYKGGKDSQLVSEYNTKKETESEFLYRSVSKALQIDIKEIRERAKLELVGTPLTHERYLNRYKGTYGAAWGAMLEGPVTPIKGLLLCGDSVFPGIGVPAVALSGVSAANTMMNVIQHCAMLLINK